MDERRHRHLHHLLWNSLTTSSGERLRYISVVVRWSCPRRRCSVGREIPFWTAVTAKVCRLCLQRHRRHYVDFRTITSSDFAFDRSSAFSDACAQYRYASTRHSPEVPRSSIWHRTTDRKRWWSDEQRASTRSVRLLDSWSARNDRGLYCVDATSDAF